MAKILADDIIPELKSTVNEAFYEPGDTLYLNMPVLGRGDNSKRNVKVFLSFTKSLAHVSGAKFVGNGTYSIQWHGIRDGNYVGTVVSTTIEATEIQKDTGTLVMGVEFTQDIAPSSNYALGLVTLTGTLEFL